MKRETWYFLGGLVAVAFLLMFLPGAQLPGKDTTDDSPEYKIVTTLNMPITIDITHEKLPFHAASDPEHGSITVSDDETLITYTPNEGFSGRDSFTFTMASEDNDEFTIRNVLVGVVNSPGVLINDNLLAVMFIDYPDATSTYLVSINDSGVIAGQWWDESGSTHVLRIEEDDTMNTIALDGVRGWQMGHGINNEGQLTGDIGVGGRIMSFILDDNGHRTDFAYENSSSTPTFKINDAGQTVGRTIVDGSTHGFLRQPDGSFELFDVPEADGLTWALGINNDVDIVGFYQDENGDLQGFWRTPDEQYQTISPPDAVITRVYDINDQGVIVGEYSTGETGGPRRSMEHLNFRQSSSLTIFEAFVYADGEFHTFTIPGAQSTSAWGINKYGNIVGIWVDDSGLTHGYQLTTIENEDYVIFE